jgi:ATPase subunit of ABC transporter with duplicated ATPase domains
MTSHDREFMNRLVTKIVEIDGGELITYSGNYDFYERSARSRAAARGAVRAAAGHARQGEAFIERFKARASHAAQVQSRVKKLEKIEKVEPPKRRKVVEFDFRQPPRSGDDVVKLEG